MALFFTSDTHFGHANIIKYCQRPYTSVEDMDDALIRNWNAAVGPSDTVCHLGDFAMGRGVTEEYLYSIRRKLNGLIVLLQGNHDVGRWDALRRSFLPEDRMISGVSEMKEGGELLVLFHYPMRSWPKKEHGSWHLFGHTHGTVEPLGKSFDVGVDANNFSPLSFRQVADKMGIK